MKTITPSPVVPKLEEAIKRMCVFDMFVDYIQEAVGLLA
jgi:hypothetical protein